MAGKVVVLLFPLLVFMGAPVPARASLHALLESPGNGPVSGVDVIRGWVFSETPGVSPVKTELWVDGGYVTTIPCCGERADVQAAFPQFPSGNTRNSSFGLTFNYGNLSAGSHAVQVTVVMSDDGRWESDVRTITVVKLGGFSYLRDLAIDNASRSAQ